MSIPSSELHGNQTEAPGKVTTLRRSMINVEMKMKIERRRRRDRLSSTFSTDENESGTDWDADRASMLHSRHPHPHPQPQQQISSTDESDLAIQSVPMDVNRASMMRVRHPQPPQMQSRDAGPSIPFMMESQDAETQASMLGMQHFAPPHQAYSNQGKAVGSVRKRRGNHPKHSVNILKRWLHDHPLNNYPSSAEKQALSQEANLTVKEVHIWFNNVRHRKLADMIRREARPAGPVLASAPRHEPHTMSRCGRKQPLGTAGMAGKGQTVGLPGASASGMALFFLIIGVLFGGFMYLYLSQ